LNSIPRKNKQHAWRLLQFLTFSDGSIGLDEAVDIVAVDTRNKPYFHPKYRMPIPEEISRYCSNLVSITSRYLGFQDRETVAEIQFIHFSVKEYLMSNRIHGDIAKSFTEASARSSIADVCLAYLLELDHDLPKHTLVRSYPFVEFSAIFWTDNARIAEEYSGKPSALSMEFFSNEKTFRTCTEIYFPSNTWKTMKVKKEPLPKLHYACAMGLRYSTQALLENGAKINEQNQFYGSALEFASAYGHKEVIQVLLDHGANVNTQGEVWISPLRTACWEGHYDTAQLLLKKGAKVNDHDGCALIAASEQGHGKIIKLLLSKGADVNIGNGAALVAAVYTWFWETLSLLVGGIDIDVEDSDAVIAASPSWAGDIVELLLHNGADAGNLTVDTLIDPQDREQHEVDVAHIFVSRTRFLWSIRNR
jgi:hypothetical protein